ncbi:MAG: HD domain-containing phosphohydrolase [Sandaracinus sp.]
MQASPNILIVDDEPLVLRALDCALRRGGFRTVPVTDTASAKKALADQRVDAIVADLNMPLDDGRYFASVLRAERPEPVVVVTGTRDFRDVTRMLGGALPSALLAKPFEPSELARVVASVLSTPSARDERRLVRQLAEGMALALATRDVETHAHAERVARWSARIAIELGLPPDDCFWLEIGALLHDVGKIGVPDAILKKAGSLTPDEWVAMRRHPQIGADLLAPIERLTPAIGVVLHHHEAFDGSGYPRGLAGERIPLAARAFAPVDAYDAMTSDRPYRRGMSHDDAMARLEHGRGTQFDPVILDAIKSIGRDEWLAIKAGVEPSSPGILLAPATEARP